VDDGQNQSKSEFIDKGEFNKEFLQIMHFENETKNMKTSKIS
jgi:hypothetical protein